MGFWNMDLPLLFLGRTSGGVEYNQSCAFLWEATREKILTFDQLWRSLVLANRCCLFQESEGRQVTFSFIVLTLKCYGS